MIFITGVLTVVLVLDCLLLILLVLIQLPKKEAGAGLAFGGAATDALFGAGSGNALTKVTKYATAIFFVLAIVLAVSQRSLHGRGKDLQEKLSQQTGQLPGNVPAPPAPATAPTAPLLGVTNSTAEVPVAEPPPATPK